MADTPQSYKNHARLDPAYHIVLTGLNLLSFVLSVAALVRHPGLEASVLVVLTITLFLNSALTRIYPLKVQDRLIRLEERQRLSLLLPEAEKAHIRELTERQLIALRFASDAELPVLAIRALHEHLTSKQIKAAIVSWRADTFRV